MLYAKDSAGISNLFVLDLCDTANIQDPRDGRTSLITAVLDNDEVLRRKLRIQSKEYFFPFGPTRFVGICIAYYVFKESREKCMIARNGYKREGARRETTREENSS